MNPFNEFDVIGSASEETKGVGFLRTDPSTPTSHTGFSMN
jgi:hypothetical protein